jgi:hypothetical protein
VTVDLTGAPALTLRLPWAHLIAFHGKNVENRGWMPPEHVHRLLVHSGKGWDRDAEQMLRDRNLDIDGVQPSAIVAVADLAFACDTSRTTPTVVCACGEWAMAGQCHWNLANVHYLPDPVPAKGRQGLWRPAPNILAAVERQLAVVR